MYLTIFFHSNVYYIPWIVIVVISHDIVMKNYIFFFIFFFSKLQLNYFFIGNVKREKFSHLWVGPWKRGQRPSPEAASGTMALIWTFFPCSLLERKAVDATGNLFFSCKSENSYCQESELCCIFRYIHLHLIL